MSKSVLQDRLDRRREFEDRAREWKTMTKESVYGAEVGLAIVAGALLGYLFDRNFETAPWGMLVGLGFGIATAVRTLYRISKRVLDADALEEAEREKERA